MVASAQSPGRLKVFIGMAAGVGKTYRMLLEGHAEQETGRDVVMGLLETHGRAETARVAEGLPLVPRRRVRYRDTVVEEMDLPAILSRTPELCLIDELVGSREQSLAADAPHAVGERRWSRIRVRSGSCGARGARPSAWGPGSICCGSAHRARSSPRTVACVAALLGIAAGYWLPPHGRLPARERFEGERRILLPFTGEEISRRSFEAAVRLAKAENAIIMPAFLARVPMNLPLETALPVQCARGMPLLEAIEQRASSQGVPVDSRVGRGRSARDALRKLLEQEQFDRIIVSADEDPRVGLSYEDLRWMLDRVPAEILILRPAPEDMRTISTEAVKGHF